MSTGVFPVLDKETFRRNIVTSSDIIMKTETALVLPGDVVELAKFSSSLRFPLHLTPRISWSSVGKNPPFKGGDLGLVVKFSEEGYPLCVFGEHRAWFFLHELKLVIPASEMDIRLIRQSAEQYKYSLLRMSFSRCRT